MDELRERVAKALADHDTDLHDFVGDDGDIAIYRWTCDCGEDGEAETEDDAMDAEQAHLADAVLAAIDVAGLVGKAREDGRREAAEAIAAWVEALEGRTPDEHGIVAGIPEIAEIARGFGQGAEGTRCTCPDCDVTTLTDLGKGLRRTVKGLDPECPEHGKGTVRG